MEHFTIIFTPLPPPSPLDLSEKEKVGGKGLENWPQVYYPGLRTILGQDTRIRREADWPHSAIPSFRSHLSTQERR